MSSVHVTIEAQISSLFTRILYRLACRLVTRMLRHQPEQAVWVVLLWLGESAIQMRIAILSTPSDRSFTAILASIAAREVAIRLSSHTSAPFLVEVPQLLRLQQPYQALPHHRLYLAAPRHPPLYLAALRHRL